MNPMNPLRPVVRLGDAVVWSTYYFYTQEALANAYVRLYSVAIGQKGQGKVRAHDSVDTVLREPGKVPNNMTVRAVGWEVWADDARDADAIIQHGMWAWDFLRTQLPGTPLSVDNDLIPSPDGKIVHEMFAEWQAPQPGRTYTGVYVYETPVALPRDVPFGIILRFGNGAPTALHGDVRVRFLLFGSYNHVLEMG